MTMEGASEAIFRIAGLVEDLAAVGEASPSRAAAARPRGETRSES